MLARTIVRSFSGGEVTQSLPSRDDLSKFASSCVKMRNTIAQVHGSARNRQGFQYVGDALGKSALIPFQFNTEEEDMYVLVFSNLKIKVVQDDGFVVDSVPQEIEIVSPYLEAELMQIRYAQSGDIVYLVHPNHAPQQLVRTAHDVWTLTAISFQSSVDPPTAPSAVLTGAAGTTQQNYMVTSVNSKGEESVGTPSFGLANSDPINNWTAGNFITVSWTAATGAVHYNVYKQYQGQYGLAGIVDTVSFQDDNFEPDLSVTPPIANNPFSSGNNPGAITFHNQKLFMGGPNDNPNVFYGSNIGGYTNFNKSEPVQADDSVEFRIASGVNQIEWMVSFEDLLIGTTGAELRARSASGKAIGPADILVKEQSYWGSGDLHPLIVGNSILHVERQSGSVRDLSYSNEKQGYSGSNLSILADHFFRGHKIVSWAYQQTPDSCVWAVRDDGVLLGMTYLREHEIWAWHLHETDGLFEAVTVVGGDEEDRLYASVNQEGTRRVIKLAPKWNASDGIEEAFYVDFGLTYRGAPTDTLSGLDHLAEKKVAILADGVPMEATVTAGGEVTLSAEASVIHVGLPYTSVLAPLPFETEFQDGTTQGAVRSFGKIMLRVLDSLGGQIATGEVDADPEGLDYDILEQVQENYDEAIPPFTGIMEAAPSGGGIGHTVYIRQTSPLPLNVLALISEIDIQ